MNLQRFLRRLRSSRVILLNWIITSFISTNRNAAVELKITMEAFGTEHKQQIMQELEKDGYRPKLIRTNL